MFGMSDKSGLLEQAGDAGTAATSAQTGLRDAITLRAILTMRASRPQIGNIARSSTPYSSDQPCKSSGYGYFPASQNI